MYSEHFEFYHYFRRWSVRSSGRGCSQEAEREDPRDLPFGDKISGGCVVIVGLLYTLRERISSTSHATRYFERSYMRVVR
jgi:hypothetical protein